MTNTKTWLPVFSGFYGTIWDVSDNDFLDYNLKDDGLTKEERQAVYNLKCYDEASQEYRDSVVSNAVSFIERELKEYVTSIKLEGIVSPREYNFANDSINVSIELSTANIEKIREYIVNHWIKWCNYLSEHYTSRDGFWSRHSNDATDTEWDIYLALESEHNLGAILNFICDNEGITEDDMYNYGDCHDMYLSGDEVREELIADGWYDDKPEVLAELLTKPNNINSNYGRDIFITNEAFVSRVLYERNIDGDEDATEAVRKLAEKIHHIKELKDTVMPLQFKAVA